MGLRDWFARLRGKDEPAVTESDAARAVNAPAGEPRTKPADPLAPLRAVGINEAVPRAITLLDGAIDAAGAAAVLIFLRDAARHEGLGSELRVQLADFFIGRGERDAATRALRALAEQGDTNAVPAWMRLADLARERGDVDEVVRCYEEVIAVDIAYPGVRERLERLRAPARVGAEGATLLSPETAKFAKGRIELVRELGRGGAGAVFLARDVALSREVALKIYHPARRSDRGSRLRLEAQVAASLASRHVVRVLDLYEDLGAVAMEFCPGGTLRAAIGRGGHAIEVRRGWALHVARALEVAHERGWVHRDLKPGNVLLRSDGVAVLTDFGLARRIGAVIEPSEGTAGFVPPEARSAIPADPRIDVFAFGALARELLGDRDPLLGSLVSICLATDPATRPASGRAIVERIVAAGVPTA